MSAVESDFHVLEEGNVVGVPQTDKLLRVTNANHAVARVDMKVHDEKYDDGKMYSLACNPKEGKVYLIVNGEDKGEVTEIFRVVD